MTDPLFPILGSEDVPMVGRERLTQEVWSELTKTTPSNLSMVGPRYIGKTVFLKALAKRARAADSPYALVVFWELGHAPPTSDEEFIVSLCELLREVMHAAGSSYEQHRSYLQEHSYDFLKEVADDLHKTDRPILMIWDAIDKVLEQGLLTGHLFGQLRDVFHARKHKIITASRSVPRELARNKQVYDSEFWNVFDPKPVRISVFDDADHDAALMKCGFTVAAGGKSELSNWAAGHPLLLLPLLNRLDATGKRDGIDNAAVTVAAKAVIDEDSLLLKELWEDSGLSISAKDAFLVLAGGNELQAGDLGREDTDSLTSRGFATRDGKKLKLACRMLQTHVSGRMSNAGSLNKLFGTWESYRAEIRHVLEMRLRQIERPVHARLHRLVRSSIQQIPDEPDLALSALSHIEDLSLDLIWDIEFGSSREIPADVVSYWTTAPRDRSYLVKELMELGEWKVPRSRVKQISLLQLLTGSLEGEIQSKAKAVSKDAYVLITAIHKFRNRNQHSDGQEMHVGVAVSAIMACIELLDCLSREFSA